MLRRIAIFLLTFSLCWQALAAAGAGVVMADAREQAHELLHFEGIAHHHDDHGGGDGLHQDNSLSSVTHMATDSGQFSPALIFSPVVAMVPLVPIRPRGMGPSVQPLPCLDGLERPPRLTA